MADVLEGSRSPSLSAWAPEEADFWRMTGSRVAWPTLIVTTFALLLAFATWFMVSAIVLKLPGIGFKLDQAQLFWLAAMPGLAGGTLRIVHTFLIPLLGTRATVAGATLLLVVPCAGWAWAVQRPETPYGVLLVLAALAGLGGGNFSSFMPSTSLFFPKRLLGTALGVQAGVGNFGVSVAQFVIPWVIGLSILGTMSGPSQTFTKGGHATQIHLQNAALVWIPFILLAAVAAWVKLRSVPVRATLREQADIFRNKHTWLMTSLYIMTFGTFSGFAATFGALITQVFGRFPDAPDPLRFVFLGALVGASTRVIFGPLSDRFGGGAVTMLSGVGLTVSAVVAARFTQPASAAEFTSFLWTMLSIFAFAGIGNAYTFKQMPMVFPPRQASGVIGWTSAVAAYGPFVFGAILGTLAKGGMPPTVFFQGVAVFCAANTLINWWFYTRPGAEAPC